MKKFMKFFIISIVMFDFIGISMAVTLFPTLILKGNNSILYGNYSIETRTTILGILISMYPVGQFFGATLFGKLSDALGRKKILQGTLFGTLTGMIICGISIQLSMPILLFIGRFFSGLFAGNIAIAQASLLDISEDQEKAQNIGLLQATMGLGWIVGPIISAFLSDSTLISFFSTSTPFYFVSILLAILFVATILFFHETNLKPVKQKINFIEQFETIKKSFENKKLRAILFVWALFAGGWMFFEQYIPTFFNKNFEYTTKETGLLLSSLGFLYAISNIFIGKPLNKIIKPETAIKFSCIISGIFVVATGLTSNHIMVLVFIYIFCVSCIFTLPGIIVSTTHAGKQEDQGQTLGMISSIQALMTIIMSLLGGYLMGLNSRSCAIFGGSMIFCAWLFFFIYFSMRRKSVISQGEIT
jgi:predicted MFS family arabinose efflux permease